MRLRLYDGRWMAVKKARSVASDTETPPSTSRVVRSVRGAERIETKVRVRVPSPLLGLWGL